MGNKGGHHEEYCGMPKGISQAEEMQIVQKSNPCP